MILLTRSKEAVWKKKEKSLRFKDTDTESAELFLNELICTALKFCHSEAENHLKVRIFSLPEFQMQEPEK